MGKTELKRLLHDVDELAGMATALLQKLVRIPSVTGQEAEVQSCVGGVLKGLNLEVDVWCPTREELATHPSFSNDYLPLGDRPVVVGRLPGKDSKGRSLILNGHVDVVPVGKEDAWTDGPWSGAIRNGKLFGRGSCDMKGGLVSGIIGLSAVKNADIRLHGDVLIESVIGEETGGVGTLATVLPGYRADAAIVLEPTKMAICPVGAGAASFRLRVPGLATHGAMRMEGVSAVEKFYLILEGIRQLERTRHETFEHPFYKSGELVSAISIGKLQAGDWPSTVPESLVAEGRYGIFPGENMFTARADFEMAVHIVAHNDPWLRDHPPKTEWFEGQFESAQTPADSPILSTLGEAHAEVQGQPPLIHGVPYGSDLRFFTNNANVPGVLYGPGDVRLAHSVNEYVPINEVMTVAKVIALTIANWCGDDPQSRTQI
jgi:acetylornithine deacetylase